MKKKILFMLINMNIGGTEKALLNMINEIPTEKYDITIYMLEEYGGFLNHIPSGVKVEYIEGYKNMKGLINNPPHLTSLNLLRKGKVFQAISIIILHLITKLLKNRSLFFNYLLRGFPNLKDEYDLAIAYDGPNDFISYFVLKKVNSKKKIQWIHFDITKIGFNKWFASRVYKQFDRVFVVSKEAKNKLLHEIPNLKGITDVLLNCASPQIVINDSKKGIGFTDPFKGVRILTVGRLSEEKGQDLAIHVLAKLIKEGYPIKWYCVGEGNARKKYEGLIKEYHLQDHFILLGRDPNPYPYIDQCDIYVQPSRHEGYCITLMEARLLKKPIVTTNFSGAHEQITNGENGIIVDINEQEIYEALVELINNKKLRAKFSENLAKENFHRKNDIKKMLDFVS